MAAAFLFYVTLRSLNVFKINSIEGKFTYSKIPLFWVFDEFWQMHTPT